MSFGYFYRLHVRAAGEYVRYVLDRSRKFCRSKIYVAGKQLSRKFSGVSRSRYIAEYKIVFCLREFYVCHSGTVESLAFN